MLRNPYNKNTVSAPNCLPVEKELLGATSSITGLPEAETHPLVAAGPGSHIPKTRAQPIPSPTPIAPSSPLEVYTAYTRNDERFFRKIKEELSVLQKQRWPISCHESEVIYSTEWQRSKHLATANLILLLVSTPFLSTDFCYCDLMDLAVQRHRTNPLCCVMPVILYRLNPLVLERTPFGKLDFLPRNGKPISSWKDPREAYADITGYLLKQIQHMAYYL